MSYLTNEKVTVLGAAGAIGSNLAQTLVASGTASQVCMYDPFAQGLEGAAEELYHCGFPDADITWSADIAESLSGSSYVITSEPKISNIPDSLECRYAKNIYLDS